MTQPPPDNVFRQAHLPLEALLRQHLLAVVGGDFSGALAHLEQWQPALQAHMELEETRLFPQIPEDARWAARVYRLEHDRIAALAADYMLLVRRVAGQPPQGQARIRAASLGLLDAAHSLRHLLEHHHEREEKALAQELPPALQRAVLQPACASDPAR